MALIIFKYCLPILLGLTLFAGITGRYSPLPRPKALAKRPVWFLGLWTGVSVGAITLFGLDIAYRMELNEIPALLIPGLWLMAAAMIPGIICFLWYRASVKRQIASEQDTRLIGAIEQADSDEFDNTLAVAAPEVSELDATAHIDDSLILDSELLETERQYGSWTKNLDLDDAEEVALEETQLFDVNDFATNEPSFFAGQLEDGADVQSNSEALGSDRPLKDTATEPQAAAVLETVDAGSKSTEHADDEELSGAEANTDADSTMVISAEFETNETEDDLEAELIEEATRIALADEINRLQDDLAAETKTREELEQHLRITRKGLGELESESREFESNKAAALMEIEQQLEEKIKRTSAAEARAEREAEKRAALELQMVQIREDALKATNESRLSTESRAKALSTASKATTIARQAMQVRTRLETQLHDAQAEVDSKQNTISSLIKALEKEKSRTQDEVASMAKQLTSSAIAW